MIKEITQEQAWQIRHNVMWPEKPFDYIKVDGDDRAIHYGLFIETKLISVISLFINNEEAQFRKFATITTEQNKGYGSTLLRHTLIQAKLAGVQRIWCNARTNKSAFYQKFGLQATDQSFSKGGKEYLIMEKQLSTETT
ncbi:MAG TPA: GNAT family N-acetyltransferase [Bacilli bacterium]|nr:GNAT family N-acetyltransferase [Bacilli bacterium]